MVFTPPPRFPRSRGTETFLTVKEGSTSHLGLLPSGKKRETALLGAQNRYALRLADHQRSRQVLRDGTAWLKWRPHGWAWFAIMDLWNTDFEGKEPLVEDLKNQCHWECVYFVGR